GQAARPAQTPHRDPRASRGYNGTRNGEKPGAPSFREGAPRCVRGVHRRPLVTPSSWARAARARGLAVSDGPAGRPPALRRRWWSASDRYPAYEEAVLVLTRCAPSVAWATRKERDDPALS